MEKRCGKNDRRCATCDLWCGVRSFKNGRITYDINEGKCSRNKKGVQGEKRGCSYYKTWSTIELYNQKNNQNVQSSSNKAKYNVDKKLLAKVLVISFFLLSAAILLCVLIVKLTTTKKDVLRKYLKNYRYSTYTEKIVTSDYACNMKMQDKLDIDSIWTTFEYNITNTNYSFDTANVNFSFKYNDVKRTTSIDIKIISNSGSAWVTYRNFEYGDCPRIINADCDVRKYDDFEMSSDDMDFCFKILQSVFTYTDNVYKQAKSSYSLW